MIDYRLLFVIFCNKLVIVVIEDEALIPDNDTKAPAVVDFVEVVARRTMLKRNR